MTRPRSSLARSLDEHAPGRQDRLAEGVFDGLVWWQRALAIAIVVLAFVIVFGALLLALVVLGKTLGQLLF